LSFIAEEKEDARMLEGEAEGRAKASGEVERAALFPPG